MSCRRVMFPAPLLVACSLSLACGGAESTAPFTPDGAILIGGAPPGWFISGSQPAAYSYGVDKTNKQGGTNSAYIRSLSGVQRTGFATIMQQMKADSYRGKRVRLTAWVANSGVEGFGGALWLRFDGAKTSAIDNMGNRPIKGTEGWHQVGVVVDIPQEAIGLAFGFYLDGEGVLNADELQLEIVGNNVPATASAPVAALSDSASTARGYAARQTTPLNLNFESVAGLSNVIPAVSRP